MTEIPEHLLKRAKERRAAMSGGEAPADAPAAAPAPSGDAAPATPEKAPKTVEPLPTLGTDTPATVPDIPVVAAAKARRRVPYWAAAVLASLPLWALLYAYSVAPPPAEAAGAMAEGADVYVGCQGCHGPTGAGGATGAQLNDGHVQETFTDPLTMIHWIAYGMNNGGAHPDRTYSPINRPDLPAADMPGQADILSAGEIAAVTIYIREGLSGGTPADDPNFNSELYDEDPAWAADIVQQVIDIGPTGEPDVSGIEAAETE